MLLGQLCLFLPANCNVTPPCAMAYWMQQILSTWCVPNTLPAGGVPFWDSVSPPWTFHRMPLLCKSTASSADDTFSSSFLTNPLTNKSGAPQISDGRECGWAIGEVYTLPKLHKCTVTSLCHGLLILSTWIIFVLNTFFANCTVTPPCAMGYWM